jgi:hypothetical protein
MGYVLGIQRWKATLQRSEPPQLRANSSCAQKRDPEEAPLSLRSERCTGKGFPTGNASRSRAARNAARERWSGPNPPQTCRTQAKGCRRRGIALQPCAQGKQNSEPYCIQFPQWLVTASMVRKDSPVKFVEKLGNAVDRLPLGPPGKRSAAEDFYGGVAELRQCV